MSRIQITLSIILYVLLVTSASLAAQENPIISYKDGRLTYHPDDRGNRVPDFSHCGYAGGNRPIPEAPVCMVVAPVAGDNTERIQNAIDYVAGLPEDANGIRGAVLLLKGRHKVLGGLHITRSGVVLRGQGMGKDGTMLFAAGVGRRTLIRVFGQDDRMVQTNAVWQITDDYVPVGAMSFRVKDASGLNIGDTIRVVRPSSQAWIEQIGMFHFGGEKGGFRWKPASRDIVWDRVIQSIDGNLVTVDAPITTSLEKEFGGGRIETYFWPGRITNVGIENLQLVSEFDPANPRDESHSWCAITMENSANAWVRQVTFRHFAGSAIAIYESCKQVTVEDCLSLEPVSEEGGYRRNTFFTMGQMTLFIKCYAEHGRHDFSVGHCAAGPNAFVQCDAHLPLADSGPIESWCSGILYDNVRIDGDALTLGHRGSANQGAGWSAANCVAWQCRAAVIRCYQPPTAQNWSLGSWSGFEGDGIWRSSNEFVSPDSLYAGQLKDRLGAEAARRLQLMPRSLGTTSNPSLDKAQELAAEAHQPAPLLCDYIARASERNLIPDEPGDARRIEMLPNPQSVTRNPQSPLLLTNGRLTVDGKLLIGGTTGVQWWRGSIRPDEAVTFGLGVTRFVPGRIGPGFTDDLNDVADSMMADGRAALDHNYGLWYDRRRDDHEHIRRMDGDVWPPFYEQPFARSSQGTAWDGLSKYDLTRFNPWYWNRLRTFTDICDENGLVLFHQNYFQHNILEAGAHWADFPWRTANNINNTRFPEPPNYDGDKRIFMAELFYDVNHPVRRELHRNYIRQCLDNFIDNTNVIQFTSGEFTGPQHFMAFWLDTIAQWEQEKHRHPFIALSCTKDVQDAILADSGRSAIVDIIDFRYWWRTDRGQFAPPGGMNLAPRQFERRWRGGRPDDEDLAGMAAEYHARHPDKGLICDFDSAGWAWVCAGGSLPRLPGTTDAKLLVAIPQMKPWPEASQDGNWVLREAGKQLLAYLGNNSELDLSEESGTFRINTVNTSTGSVTAGEIISAGTDVTLPPSKVIWLTRE